MYSFAVCFKSDYAKRQSQFDWTALPDGNCKGRLTCALMAQLKPRGLLSGLNMGANSSKLLLSSIILDSKDKAG